MKRSLLIATIFAITTTVMAEDVVYYADTKYGPSDNVVHYDMDRGQENSTNQTNVPNNEVYPQSDK